MTDADADLPKWFYRALLVLGTPLSYLDRLFSLGSSQAKLDASEERDEQHEARLAEIYAQGNAEIQEYTLTDYVNTRNDGTPASIIKQAEHYLENIGDFSAQISFFSNHKMTAKEICGIIGIEDTEKYIKDNGIEQYIDVLADAMENAPTIVQKYIDASVSRS